MARRPKSNPAQQLRFFIAGTVIAVTIFIIWNYLEKAGVIQPEFQPTMEQQTIAIKTQDGREHKFQVELARTPEEIRKGLMFREHMPADAGMLFLFEEPQILSFWMKNTLIPLDMVFIAKDGRIIKVHENAVPHSLSTVSSDGPAVAGLELNAGTAKRLNIQAGDWLMYDFNSD